jgi:membrane protein
VQGFREKRLNFQAAALTYYSVLSIVPFLAFAFSVLKGFGGYQRLMDQSLRPYLKQTFGGNASLLNALEQMLNFVERTDVSSLGMIGVLFLVYTSINLLSTIETALNEIWGAKSSRPLLRQVTDYTTLMVVTPLLAAAAITFGTAAQSSGIITFLRTTLGLGGLIDFALGLTSLVLGCIALIAVYIIMPNVRVRVTSAIFGGVIGGILWQLGLLLQVKVQVGVANYNALYSGFGAIPIFLVWLYLSWMIVLVGAQLAASHQYEQHLRQAVRARHVDQELRETLAIAVATDVARRFLQGCPPHTQAALAEALEVPPPAVEEVVNALVRASVIVRAVCGHEIGYMPARDLDDLRVADVREAVRIDPAARELKDVLERRLDPALRDFVQVTQLAARKGPNDLTLRELAERSVTEPPVEEPAERPQTEVIDGKQPDVPS